MHENKKITQKDILKEITTNSFLIPEDIKKLFIDSLHHDSVESSLVDFFDEYHDYEKEILWAINEEFPNITKQMMSHIELHSTKQERSEVEDLVSEINIV